MILPTKYIREEESLMGLGCVILEKITFYSDLSTLWESVKNDKNFGTFERFILTLDLLFIMGLIEFDNNKIKRVEL